MSCTPAAVVTYGLMLEGNVVWVISVNGKIHTVGWDRDTVEDTAAEIRRCWTDQDRASA